MAGDTKKKRPAEVQRRRKGAPRKRLSPELEALARGDDKPFRRPRKERLKDPRAVALIPGVANRDARAVADARVEALRAMMAWDDREALEAAFADFVVLRLWRGRSITSLDALAEDLLEVPPADAHEAASAGATRTGRNLEPLDDVSVASWLRTEAAMLEAEIDAKVRVDGDGRLVLDFPAPAAPEAFDAIARRLGPLLEDRRPPRPPRRDGDGDGRPPRGGDGRPPRGGDGRPPRGGGFKKGRRD